MPVLNHRGEKPTPDELLAGQILDIVNSTECYCGEAKLVRRAFCKKCYWSLPPERRATLRRRFGEGYETAYRQSLKYLAAQAA